MIKTASIPSKGGFNKFKDGRKVSNSFYDFSNIMGDESWCLPIDNITEDEIDQFNIIFLEVGTFNKNGLKVLMDYKRNGGQCKYVFFGCSIPRFCMNVSHEVLPLARDLINRADLIGTMNASEIPFYESFAPDAGHIIHMPAPVPDRVVTDRQISKNKIILSMHTDLTSISHARRSDLINFMLWNEIKKDFPDLIGYTFFNYKESVLHGKMSVPEMRNVIQKVLDSIGVKDVYVKETTPNFNVRYSDAFCALGLNTFHCQSRISQWGASNGIPVIASDVNDTQTHLFPYLTVEPFDTVKGAYLFKKLQDKTTYNTVMWQARHALEYYSIDRTRQRITEALLPYPPAKA